MSAFPNLARPLRVGAVTLRNRIVMAPHSVSFLPGHGNPIDRIVDYHVERARGGAAMIVMSSFVTPPSWREMGSWGGALRLTPLGGLDMATDPALIAHYKRLADGIHAEGAVFVAQLNATGRQYWTPGALSYGMPLFAPSPLPCPKLRQIPKEMETADIAEFVDAFAAATGNMREAGADGVELFAAQGYLISAFLSPSSNRRTDRYGGSLDNRMRFLIEALEAIRKAAGSGFVVGVRMNGDDFTPGGIDLQQARQIAARLDRSGLVDYLNVSGMTSLHFPGWIADLTAPEATFATLSAAIKEAAPRLPVCVVSRIGSPETAERVLAQGQADMVGMARALIADPEFPNKALKGDPEDIRRCTYSNQSCIMSQAQGRGVACLHNVAVGKEAAIGIGKLVPAPRRKKVVVVGGGPAGMAAARIAAERGHAVTLIERDAALGGQNRMTAMIAARRGFAEVTRWQERQLRRHGVAVVLGTEATVELVLGGAPDAVIVATGSRPGRTGYSSQRPEVARLPGVDLPHVLTVWDVFRSPERLGRRIALIEDDPHLAGVYTAEHLADLGKSVELVTPQVHAGRDLHVNFVGDLYRRLRRKGIVIAASTCVVAIEPQALVLADSFTGATWRSAAFDSVILSTGNEAEASLYFALQGRGPELHRIGDCLAPRRIDDAIVDGERVGRML